MAKPKMVEKHAPGPWTCYADLPSTEPKWHIVTTANKMRVLANVHIEPGNVMDEANARLITAAPDLYAALVEAKQEMWLAARHQWTMADFKNWAVIQQIDAALEKADGLKRITHRETEAA